MLRRFLFLPVLVLLVVPAGAASFVNQSEAVCDPGTPANCAKPDSNGALPVTMGAVPTGAATEATLSAFKTATHTDLTAPLTVAPSAGAATVTAPTVGVSSAQALAAGTRKYLFMQNVSASASIACRTDGGTAALNTAGSFMLPPLASRTWEGSATPNAAITCIASAASTPATIESQ